MKTVIVGSKTSIDYLVFKSFLDVQDITELIVNGENHLDGFSKKYSQEQNIPLNKIPQKDESSLVKSCQKLIAIPNGNCAEVSSIIKEARNLGKEVLIIQSYPLGRSFL